MLNLNLLSNNFYSLVLIFPPSLTKICLLPFSHENPLGPEALYS